MLILESLLKSQKATGTPSKDIDAGASHFGEHILPQEHWFREVPFWSCIINLLVSWLTHIPTGLSLTPGCHRLSNHPHRDIIPHTNSPEHTLGLKPPTSGLAPNPGPSRPYHQPSWKLTLKNQQASTALGLLRPHSQPHGKTALLTTGPAATE